MAGKAKRILVVDDEPGLRRAVVRILRKRGFEVLEAEGPRQALELLDGLHEGIDLLVTDVVMPGGGGGQLAEDVAKRQENLGVLFMTGYSDDSRIGSPSQVPVCRVIHKPFRAKDILSMVDDLLIRRVRT